MKKLISLAINICIMISLLIPYGAVEAMGSYAAKNQEAAGTDLFRASLQIKQAYDFTRLETKNIKILETSEGTALVLVTGEQLESLARLGFEVLQADELGSLLKQADQPPAFASQVATVMEQLSGNVSPDAVIAAFSPSQLTVLGAMSSIDDDADGLTNTQEQWWCTDPGNPDTDSDGRTDGVEIQALKDWMGNRRASAPGETPWASWPFNTTTCPDKDYDSIPNLAEKWELGLNMDLESTDRDRYDDGQETFGITYCPGSGNSCGYGTLPSANHDGILLFPQMPAWVTFPGNHPAVSSYPKLQVDIVPDINGNTFRIRAATTITTEKVTLEGETKLYSTTQTNGTSTSNAETESFEEFQQYSKTTELPTSLSPAGTNSTTINSVSQKIQTTHLNTTNSYVSNYKITQNIAEVAKKTNPVMNYLADKVYLAADFTLNEACEELNCKKYGGAAVKATARTLVDIFTGSDNLQNTFLSNKCDLTGLDLKNISCRLKSVGTLWKNTYDDRLDAATLEEQEAKNQVAGTSLTSDGTYMNVQKLYPITYPVPSFTPTETYTSGTTRGRSQTVTNTQYQEHSVTEGTEKQFSTSWGTATAENSVHAADLWFAYQIKNIGSDYAREICNLAINVYIGKDLIPASTYYPGQDLGGDGCFANFQPGESHVYAFPSSKRIELTLDQLRAIDLGEPVRIVIEDYSLGQDDFYVSDSTNGNYLVSIDDGTQDGDESVDTYLLAFQNGDTTIDALARFFPNYVDDYGMMTAIWTPESRSDSPAWCNEPMAVNNIIWCKHALTTSEWWNVFTSNYSDGSESYQDAIITPGSVALIRFNQDDDSDGYSNLTEERLGTDKYNGYDYPQPELIAGMHHVRNGDEVVATLSLENIGLYDAYGIEAIMIAPDDSITITNNTVGGSGRVKAGKSVVVGSFVLPVATGTWTGTAKPFSGGYYTGTEDRLYTFTINCSNPGGCDVSSGSWGLAWEDDAANSGMINFGDGYASPTLLDVGGSGVKVGLQTGRVYDGNSFSVEAHIPRDTFKYLINEEPFTQPVVIVSYNDPQGDHRFMLPSNAMNLIQPGEDLAAFSGQMIDNPGIEIVTGSSFVAGVNTTDIVINNPSEFTITDSNILLEFLDIDGNVVLENKSIVSLKQGPSVVSIEWNTAEFSPVYSPENDYLVLAFWTDYEGNVLNTTGRPLSSFQVDPQARFAMDEPDSTWNFGETAQGTLLKRTFTFANVGEGDLLTFIDAPAGMTVSQVGSRNLAPAEFTRYEIDLNTADLPLGIYDQTVSIRTNDPENPLRSIHVVGTVIQGTADIPAGSVQRPLDYAVTVPGPQTQGTWYNFEHPLGPDVQSLHPVKVFNQDYFHPWGVGRYATSFSAGTASYEMFGDGSDGNLLVPAGNVKVLNTPYAFVTSDKLAGSQIINVNSVAGFNIGDEVMILQSQGDITGKYEFSTISEISGQTITLTNPIKNSYKSLNAPCGGNFVAQYYNNKTLSDPPVLQRCEASVTMDAEGGSPAPGVNGDNFSIRWTGPRYISQEADYDIGVWVDDGIRVYVDGTLVLNQWPYNGWYSTNVHLSVGWHTFVIDYYEDGGTAHGAAGIPGALWHTQIIKVPHYLNVTIESGATLIPPAWDGLVGGVLAFRASGNVTINGTISGTGYGYRGGDESPTTMGTRAAEGSLGFYNNIFRDCWSNRNANGIGGGSGHCWIPDGWGVERYASGGGGGGNETEGSGGLCHTGTDRCWCAGGGGYAIDDNNFAYLIMGGGGGGGGASKDSSNNGQPGGDGGGILYFTGRNILVSGSITSNGTNGSNVVGYDQWTAGAGGGGAGGSIYMIGSNVNITGAISAVGGVGGSSIGQGAGGGYGGSGRVRIDYCESLSGNSNPAASTQKLNCYMAEQLETAPSTTRLNLPENFTTDITYAIQYGRRMVFTGSGNQTGTLRVPGGMLSSVTLDTLISGVGTGSLTVNLDIGNDGGTDYTYTGTVTDNIALDDLNLTQAFNRWWAASTRPTSGTMEVPVKVTLSKAGQVLLTDLQVQTAGSTLRTVRLPVDNYQSVQLAYTLNGYTGPATIGIDVGDDDTVEDVFTDDVTGSTQIISGDLAAAINLALSGQTTAEVNVPVRFLVSPEGAIHLDSYEAILSDKPDAGITASDILLPTQTPVEGETVQLNAVIHNPADVDTGGLTGAFFAQIPDGTEWYIGSVYIPNIPRNESKSVVLNWNTLGFNGDVPIRLELDPYNQLDEALETNNIASVNLHIHTRADLEVKELDEPSAVFIDENTADVLFKVNNNGDTPAIGSILSVYDGDPQAGGVLIGSDTSSIPANAQVEFSFSWQPTEPGPHRIYVIPDETDVIGEGDESNNIAWKDIYVGLKSPILLDSGVPASDPAYNSNLGFGYQEAENTALDVLTTCGAGTLAENTLRRDPDGVVQYRFDHLVPSHYYHLDLILFECDGAGRQESIMIDGYQVAGPEDLGDGQVHRLSFLVDPALYLDRTLQIQIVAPGIDGSVVGGVNLHDVDYRYIDAGNSRDLQYSPARGYGWLDGNSMASLAWGRLPYQSLRIDQSDDQLTYRFDNLHADKNYSVHLTLWQKEGTPRLQKVLIDGVETSLIVNTGDYQVHRETLPLPPETYLDDGSVLVTFQRLGANGAMVNEISLEEATQSVTSDSGISPTPFFSDVFGNVTVNVTTSSSGDLAPAGTLIQAFDPRGQLVGSFIVSTSGQYGYMRIYGEDATAAVPIPGMRSDELVSFKVNGIDAVATPSFYWEDDHLVHRVDLAAGEINRQIISLRSGWNFISFYYEPPSPVLTNVLESIYNRYDRVLSETGVFVPGLPDTFNTLRELHSTRGYYLRVTDNTSINLLVDGIHQSPDKPIPLHQGWNWIGYLHAVPMNIQTALASIQGKFQLVSNLELTYNPNDPIHSTLNQMRPGEGYMIYMTESAILTYPGSAAAKPEGEAADNSPTYPEVNVTPDKTIIYGEVFINEAPAPVGTWVDVYSPEGLLAGRFIVQQTGVLGYTHIFGDPANPEHFQDGEPLTCYVNGFPAEIDGMDAWFGDHSPHAVTLSISPRNIYLPVLRK